MYFEIDREIVQALKQAFSGKAIAQNIYPVITKQDVKTTPLKFPAIRVVFLGVQRAESLDTRYEQDIVQLKYGVIYYFRSFRDKTAQDIYPDLRKIVETLRGHATSKGVLDFEGCELISAGNCYAYMGTFQIETVV